MQSGRMVLRQHNLSHEKPVQKDSTSIFQAVFWPTDQENRHVLKLSHTGFVNIPRCIVLCSVLFYWACGGDSTSSSNGGGTDILADADSGGPLTDTGGTADVGSLDSFGEKETTQPTLDTGGSNPSDAASDSADSTPDLCPGGLLCACTKNNDCLSGYCIDSPQGPVCTTECFEDCPDGFKCKLKTGSEGVYLCVSAHVQLCLPCDKKADCAGGFQADNACLSYGTSGSFCGTECDVDDDCPTGYICDDADGSGNKQCILASGECSCSPYAITLAAQTTCTTTNEFGTCSGKRVCTVEGLSACDATPAAPEVCNGKDDDCDGTVDEDTGGAACTVTSAEGTCPGVEACVGAKSVCQGQTPEKDSCNGKDDDCDGEVDEGFVDTDNDGDKDCVDTDKDGDGLDDINDNCPLVSNPTQDDLDKDKIGDACDTDDDEDGVPDTNDNCPTVVNSQQIDTDKDGAGDACDSDDDNDTVLDTTDNCPLTANTDQSDIDGDAVGDVCDDDLDGDTVVNSKDNCPNFPNTDQVDLDKNGIGDACDNDVDGDGIPNEEDNCPDIANSGQVDTDKDGAGDVCDDDDDNDTLVDNKDNCPLVSNIDQADLDKDGLGDVCDGDIDGDKDPNETDCAPKDNQIYNGAPEACNFQDDNCDNQVDEIGALGCSLYFLDSDKDGFGQDAQSQCQCGATGFYSAQKAGDCNDGASNINPGMAEACNDIDDNCNGQVDEENAQGCTVFFRDFDNDTFGLSDNSKCLCKPSAPYSAVIGTDCNDFSPNQNPGIKESCNSLDDNCDGAVDEAGAQGCIEYFADADGDGYGQSNSVSCLCKPTAPFVATKGGDCNDSSKSIHPGAVETCDNVDNNCNSQTDEAGAEGCSTYYLDADQDGYGVSTDSKCLCKGTIPHTATKIGDCNDNVSSQNPGTAEKCGASGGIGTDDNCNGQTDEEGAQGCTVYYRDVDQDGYGIENDSKCLCAPAGIYTALLKGDCNDASFGIKPTAPEVCNGADDNCDGTIDEAGAGGCKNYLADADSDTYGVSADILCLCVPVGKYKATVGGDCDDSNNNINPGAAEICDGKDNDCSGGIDEGCDDDKDGYCEAGKTVSTPAPTTCSKGGGDCDDANPSIHPGATETCDGKDNNCTAGVDEGCNDDADAYCDAAMQVMSPPPGICPQGGGDCNDTVGTTYPGAPDLPDVAFTDSNCDGMDGNISAALFVDTVGGNDGWAGTKTNPKKTIQAAVNAANGTTITQVFVSKGTYSETVDIKSGVGIFGAYDAAANWVRSDKAITTVTTSTVQNNNIVVIRGAGIVKSTELQYLKVVAGNNSTPGGGSYGIHINGGNALSMVKLTVTSGNGGDGTSGSSGTKGSDGGTPTAGGDGQSNGSGGGGPGSGGSSSCGANGGNGGTGGHNTGGGTDGAPGGNGGGGAGKGAGGGNDCDDNGGSGGPAGAVSDGSSGVGGNGDGSVANNYWIPSNGTSGVAGPHGRGGGGGGGGAGGSKCASCLVGCDLGFLGCVCNSDRGGGGGGGGAGGCGGQPGIGATGGGGSFGIFLVNSSPLIADCAIATGKGGNGGSGGSGGLGGAGKGGASGGSGPDDAGTGGPGGSGSNGGKGGSGGGGGGGVSYGIYRANGSAPTLVNPMNYSIGAGGTGGPGGAGGSTNGANGKTAAVY